MPVENTIHPRQLNFDPPLQQYGKDGAKGFLHYWEMLDYVFGLPDPNAFPQIPVQGGDREGLLRFIEMCRRLAGFSVINDDTTLSVGTDPGTDNCTYGWLTRRRMRASWARPRHFGSCTTTARPPPLSTLTTRCSR
jgi:hypothetical protein